MNQQTHYEQIGGPEKVRELVDRFYDQMDTIPEAWEIRKMHEGDLGAMRDKFFEFLSGWMGGPQLYIEKYGHPRLRARHLPFRIDKNARDQWLLCMGNAMEEMHLETSLHKDLWGAFIKTADHMRNQNEAIDPVKPTDTNPFPIGPGAAERAEHGLD